MAHLYETMLKEMRDAAGSNGEFYTPRPVIRFIVNQIEPQIGEKILDPALGTGGFLTESFEFMRNQQKKAEDRETLQYHTFFGIEKKPMPYLLGMMNLLLHGIEKPNIRRDNSLRTPLYEITEKDRVDVIMTNPPFGGEEERGIMTNFPEAMRTAETALLFLQLIMRKLKNGGRCGMVVPNGTLFASGAGERIKKELLENFDLHTIVRLPKGVFAPYTGVETNLLFFERDGPTKEIWYYELPLPPGRQKMKSPCYTKSKPLRYEDFRDLQEWWVRRVENEFAWKVSVKDLIENECNLDVKNPRKADTEKHKEPQEIVTSIIEKENRVFELLGQIRAHLEKGVEDAN
jgi:type I restriction enzyme M protein